MRCVRSGSPDLVILAGADRTTPSRTRAGRASPWSGDFDHRWSQAREAVLVMKELWTRQEAEFHGKYYDFPPVRSYPKPAQKPHPPVILGGHAKNVLERVVEWGDGWLPNRATPAEVEMSRNKLGAMAKQAGRDPAKITISAVGQH